MKLKEYFKHLLFSAVGLASIAIGLVGGSVLTYNFGLGIGLVAGIGMSAIVLIAAGLSGIGTKAVANGSENRTWALNKAKLEEVKAARKRLSTMRMPDADIQALLKLVVTRSISYLSACESSKLRDPSADDAIIDCVSIADLYIKELDAASTEKRFNLPDSNPFADAKQRTVAAFNDRLAIVEKATMDLSGGLSSADKMEIKEYL